MFGVPDRDPSLEEEAAKLHAGTSQLLRLLEGDEDEAPWPHGGDPSVVFLLDERISPRPVRLRERPMALALLVSLILHLVILWQLRGNSLMQEILATQRMAARAVKPEDNTPFFEVVQMPKQKEEKPSNRRAPASDLDRRAHGGIGAPALTPGSHGNTPELRVEPPAAPRVERRSAGEPEQRMAARAPGKGGREAGEGAAQANGLNAAGSGADAILVVPKEGGGANRAPTLKGLSALASPGSQGALPERKGGQVDLGPLSFDTEWYDWGPYAAEMLRRIRYHWAIPEIAQMGVPGVVRIHFFIERDGRVTGVEILRESGHPPMDFAARDAILDASPLPPLPADLTGVFHEGVTITFYYNTPVPERTGRG